MWFTYEVFFIRLDKESGFGNNKILSITTQLIFNIILFKFGNLLNNYMFDRHCPSFLYLHVNVLSTLSSQFLTTVNFENDLFFIKRSDSSIALRRLGFIWRSLCIWKTIQTFEYVISRNRNITKRQALILAPGPFNFGYEGFYIFGLFCPWHGYQSTFTRLTDISAVNIC